MKSYLEKLIKVLNDVDIEKIKSIQIKTSKLKVFLTYLVSIRTADEMPKNELMKFLDVDDKMLRKMKSVLLRKCYDALAPKDGLELLDILSRYRLSENFRRELILQEKKVRRKESKAEQARYYDLSLNYFLRLPFSSLDPDELSKRAQLNLKFVEGKEKELHALLLAGRILVIRLIHEYYQRDKIKREAKVFSSTLEKLSAGEKKFHSDELKALHLFCNALFQFCIKIDFAESEKLFSKLRKNIAYTKLLPDDYSPAVNAFYASSLYYLNRYDEAIAVLEEFIKSKSPFFYNQPHLLARMSELYMIKNRMPEAYEILYKHLNRFLHSGEPDAVQIASITFTKYYLLKGNLEKAFESLQTARLKLNKKFFLLNDIDTRMLELIYFIQVGDIKFSKIILMRTLKFLREKTKTKVLKHEIEKMELLNRMCRAKTRNRSMKPFAGKVLETFKGFDTIFGMLLGRFCITDNVN